jgi:glucose-6-phosphate 1-dehydrogenase
VSARANTGVRTPDDHVLVLFGATGDLAKRKILPGLYHLLRAGLLPERYRIIGSAPPAFALGDDEFREHALDAVRTFGTGRKPGGKAWAGFSSRLSFAAADEEGADDLVAAVEKAEQEIGGRPRRLYHLAVPPVAFPGMIEMLGSSGLSKRARVIVEKPFGTDLESARALNATVHRVFDESQVFRIDHFLGKESIDNIIALRFANGFLEPIWNRNHIDAVQIDVPETLSIEGRAAFYDGTGAYRDMIVTHLLQVLGFVAMEPPAVLDADSLRAEKTKVFKSMRPLDPTRVVRGQYRGYKREKGVPRGSDTETLAAVEVYVDNWRWEGVPFYLRSGKSMAASRQSITLVGRKPPLGILAGGAAPRLTPNELVIDFADPGSISIEFLVKEPGPVRRLEAAEMRFSYRDSFCAANELEGYEHLILEAMLGDQTLFTTAEGIERLWEISMPLLEHPPPAQPYAPGTWGPKAVDTLIAPRAWHLR